MPQIVEVPELGVVEFPDDMTPEAIAGVLKKRTSTREPSLTVPERETLAAEPMPPQLVMPPSTVRSTIAGGPPVPVASLAETIAEPIEFAQEMPARMVSTEPFVPLPRMEPVSVRPPSLPERILATQAGLGPAALVGPNVPVSLGRGAVNLAIGTAEFLESPLGVMTALIGGGATLAGRAGQIINRLIAGGFSADMLKSLYQQGKDTIQNWDKMTADEKAVAIESMAGTAGMAGVLGTHALRGRKAVVPERKPPVVEETKPAEPPPAAEPAVAPAAPEEVGFSTINKRIDQFLDDQGIPRNRWNEADRRKVADVIVQLGVEERDVQAALQTVEGRQALEDMGLMEKLKPPMDELRRRTAAARSRLAAQAEPAPAPPAEKALTSPAAGEIVPPVTEQPTFKVGDKVSFATFPSKPDKAGRWRSTKRIETGTVIGLREGGKVAIVPDRVYTDPIAAREPERHAILRSPVEPTDELKPAALAAQAKGAADAIQERSAAEVPVEVPPGRGEALGAQVREPEKPAEARQTKAPEGALPLTPPAVEAAKPAVPSTERIGGIYVMDRGRLREVTPEQASKLMSMIRDKTGKGASGLGPMRLYDVNGKQIGYVSYNGNVWLGKSQEFGPSPARDELIYNATGLVKTPEGNWELPKPPYWEELTDVQDKLRALEEKHDYDPVTTAIEEPAYGPLVKQRDQILKGIYRPTTIEAETAKPTAPSTKAGGVVPVFTKAKQAAIESASKAADFLIEVGDKYSSATMPQRLKKQNESAMIRMRSAAAKLGIEVPSAGTWFMPQENARVAREVKAKLAALQGQPPPTPGAAADGPIGTQGALGGGPTPTVPPAVSTLPPKAQSQIIRDLAKGLGLPIRFGRLRTRKFGGYFQKQANLIGAQLANRLPVVTHEVGHKLDAQFDMSSDLSIRAELHVLGDPATPGSMSSWTPSKPVKYKMGEGVAEFVRYWAIDPAEAQRLAPNTFTMFENILNANKDFGDVMRTVQKDIQLWRAADPQARLRSSISTSNPNKTPYTLSQLTRDLVNDLTFLRLAVDDAKRGATAPIAASLDPYIAARNLRGSFGMAMQFINKGVVDFKTKSVQLGTSLEDALKPVSGRIQDFRDWIVAKRAQELITQGRETGLDPNDVNTVAGRFDTDPTFNAAFNAIKTWNDKVLQYAVDAGLVEQGTPATPTSPATGAFAIRQMNQDYVPFHRVFEVGAGETPSIESSGIGRGLNLGRPGSIRRLVGSTRDIIDPIESMIKNSYALVTASEKAAIHNSIAALADYPNMGKWLERVADPKEHLRLGLDKIRKQLENAGADLSLVPDDLLLDFYRNSGQAPFGENIIRIKRNGQNEFYRLNKDLFDTFHALDIEDSGRLISLMGKQAQLLRAGVTLTPDFALMNALRDTFMSAIISKHNVFPFEATIRGLSALFNKPQLVAEWAASGGKQSIEANYFDRDALQKYMRQKITKELTPAERATIVLKSPLEALRWLTGTFEEATRIGEYQKAYNDYLRQGVPEGDARRMAAFEARDRQDFAKGGARTKVVRALTPFWNAALQGTIRFAQSVKERPVQTTLKGLAYITIPKLLEQALNYTDPSYDDRPQWERDLFFLIPYGKDQNGKTKFVRIPIPFEAGVVFATFPGRIIQWLKQNDPQALTSYFSTLLQQTVPNPIPPAIQTVFSDFLSGAKGWDIYRGRQIVPESIADMPPEFQWTEQTSLTAKKLGGILGFSPMKVDHIIQQSSGGLGKQLTYQVSDRALAAITGDKRPTISAMPGMRFVTTPAGSMSQAVETFYDNLSKVKGDHEASKKIKGYQPKYSQFYTAFTRAADTMSDLRARARKTQDQVEKQKLSLQIAELARTMNAKFKGGSQPARTGTMPAGVPLPAPVPLPPMFQP